MAVVWKKLAFETDVVLNGWLHGWGKRITFTIDNSDIDAVLSDFPVLVYLSTSSGRNNDDVSAVFDELTADGNRKKIAITTSNGVTECYVEIEKWDDANEQAWLWVKVPSIASGADTILYLYYDVNHTDNTTYVGDPNSTPAENVWDANFKLVTHMRDDPNTSSIRDSTGNNNDGAKAGAGEPAVTTSGRIGDAQDFDGDNDWIDLGTPASLQITTLTIKAWIKRGATGSGQTILGSPTNGYSFYMTAVDKLALGKVDVSEVIGTGTITDTTSQHQVAVTYDGSTAKFYIDGVLDRSIAYSNPSFATTQKAIGIRPDNLDSDWNGIIDEVRISATVRTADWIKASYESERDDLLDFGSEETSPLAHKATHQNGGSDEVSVTGLSGLLADDQHVLDSEVTAVAVARSILDAHSVLMAVSDNTPVALTMAASRILGRKSSGNIVALTGAELLAILTGQAGAAFSFNSKRVTSVGTPTTTGDALRKGTALTITEMPANMKLLTITFIIDGGGSAITTGEKGHLEIPFGCTINRVTMLANQSGSIIVDIWKDTYANFPPTDADSITSSAVPTISGAVKSQDSTLTGWTTAITAGDILAFNVDSVTDIQRVTISLKVTKT